MFMSRILDILSKFETYESIRDRMLSNIPDGINKDEDSFIYNAIAPVAYELYSIHFQLLQTLNSQFVDTASSYYLTQLCKERGCNRLEARPTIISAQIYNGPSDLSLGIPVGTLYRNGTNIFKVTSTPNTLGYYTLESLTKGKLTLEDSWQPVSYTTFDRIQVGTILQEGANDETDAELKARFNLLTTYYPFAGNRGDYQNRIKTIAPDLSHVRVVTRKEEWTDHNVEIYLLKDGQPLSPLELANYKTHFNFAPVGHLVSYLTPKENTTTTLSIQAQVPLGTSVSEIESQIRYQIRKYTATLLSTFETTETTKLYNAQFIAHLLTNVPSLLNITDLHFNASDVTVTIPYDTLPVFKEDLISILLVEV